MFFIGILPEPLFEEKTFYQRYPGPILYSAKFLQGTFSRCSEESSLILLDHSDCHSSTSNRE